MKTLSEIKKEISGIESLTYDQKKEMKPADYKKLLKRLELLRTIEKYLESQPKKEFVESELNRLEKIVSAKMTEFQEEADRREYVNLTKKEVSKLKKKHESMYEIQKYRTQIRALRFISQ